MRLRRVCADKRRRMVMKKDVWATAEALCHLPCIVGMSKRPGGERSTLQMRNDWRDRHPSAPLSISSDHAYCGRGSAAHLEKRPHTAAQTGE